MNYMIFRNELSNRKKNCLLMIGKKNKDLKG